MRTLPGGTDCYQTGMNIFSRKINSIAAVLLSALLRTQLVTAPDSGRAKLLLCLARSVGKRKNVNDRTKQKHRFARFIGSLGVAAATPYREDRVKIAPLYYY